MRTVEAIRNFKTTRLQETRPTGGLKPSRRKDSPNTPDPKESLTLTSQGATEPAIQTKTKEAPTGLDTTLKKPVLSTSESEQLVTDPKASIAVITEPETPEVETAPTFGQMVKNETARASLLGLLDNEKWQPQLEGSKLQKLRPELEKPGADVKGLLSKALGELEDGYTAAHMKRAVDKVGMPLAEELGMSGEEKSALKEVSGLYDIGKLAVNESILDFDGKWPEDKAGQWFGQVSNHVHPEIVEPLLAAFNVSDLGKQAVLHHHERPNGWAYCKDSDAPAWKDVPGVARVIGMADTVDAMQWRKANINRPVEAKLDRATMQKFLTGDAEKGKVDGELVKTVFCKVLPE